MMAICPAGPPKLMKPSFSQKRRACLNDGADGAAAEETGSMKPQRTAFAPSRRDRGVPGPHVKISRPSENENDASIRPGARCSGAQLSASHPAREESAG